MNYSKYKYAHQGISTFRLNVFVLNIILFTDIMILLLHYVIENNNIIIIIINRR